MKIKKIYRLECSEEVIRVEFEHEGQEAEFEYTLIGREIGIDNCSYVEKENEDIYSYIHDWVEEHITTETKVFYDDKKLNYDGIILK